MKNNRALLSRGLFLLWLFGLGAGLTACSFSTDQDQDEAIMWALIAERDSLQQVINGLEDENLYLYEELETIKSDCGVE